MARPTDRERDELSGAVIELRRRLGDTQQEFASRLGVAMASVARYETSRRPRGEVLLVLERVAKESGEHQLATIFRKALALEMDWAHDPSEPVWSGVVRELVRNARLCPGWPSLAESLLAELSALIAKADEGAKIEGQFKRQGDNIANLQSWQMQARRDMEGSAGKLLNKLTDERLNQHPEETHDQAFGIVLVNQPELHIQYRQEQADAAHDTRFSAMYGNQQQAKTRQKQTRELKRRKK